MAEVAECPHCGMSIFDTDERPDCPQCTKPLPEEIKRRLPKFAVGMSVGHPQPELVGISQAQLNPGESTDAIPALVVVFRVLAALELLGGAILTVQLWPGEAKAGYEWRAVAYVPALTWLSAGVVFGFLFWAIGDGLLYLRQIRDALTTIGVLRARAPDVRPNDDRRG